MAWPTTPVATGDLISAAQLNLLPVRLADSTVVGAAVASLDISSIPAIYSHLEVWVEARSDNAGALLSLSMYLNSDNAANYFYEETQSSAAAVTASEGLAQTSGFVGRVPGAGAASAAYSGTCVIQLPNYAKTTWRKRWTSEWSVNTDGLTGTVRHGRTGGFWNTSNTTDRVTLFASSGLLIAGSRVTIYGRP